MIEVKVKRLTPSAKLPTRAYEHDAGWDLYVDGLDYSASNMCKISFGVALEIPAGFVGLIFPRSSIRNTNFRLSNSVGVIDSGYRGEISAVFDYHGLHRKLLYNEGDKAAQIVFLKLPDVQLNIADELSDSERGTGGYGSSGA